MLIRGAWTLVGDGRYCMILSPAFPKADGLRIGDLAGTRFRIDDQGHVDTLGALSAHLAQYPDRPTLWDALTPGKRRALAHHVGTAKTDATREKRLDEVGNALAQGLTLRDILARRGEP